MHDTAPADTRERILHIAARLFADQGFDAVSVREVCEGAGVSKPVIYYHFKSRDGLVLAVLEHLGEGFARLARHHLAGQPASVDSLVGLVEGMLDLGTGDGWVVRMMQRMPGLDPRILSQLPGPEAHEAPLVKFIEAGVKSGAFPPNTDAHAVVWLLFGAFGRMAMLRLCCADAWGSREMAERLVLQALGQPTPTLPKSTDRMPAAGPTAAALEPLEVTP